MKIFYIFLVSSTNKKKKKTYILIEKYRVALITFAEKKSLIFIYEGHAYDGRQIKQSVVVVT